jgi:hypothetical protein
VTLATVKEAADFCASNRGFIKVTEVRLQFSVGDNHGRFVVEEDLNVRFEDFI